MPSSSWNPMRAVEEALEINKKLVQELDTLLSIKEIDVDLTPKDVVYEEDKLKLYRYRPVSEKIIPVPLLIVYALVNRQYMMDLHTKRSLIQNWLQQGLDVYIIDWGYPDRSDRYLGMEDYIDGYLNNVVDVVRQRSGVDKINILGVCQGGTFSIIYSALYPEKIRNLITLVTPFDFSVKDGLLFCWSKYIDVDRFVDAFGMIQGNYMNMGFLMLKPFQQGLDKYISLLNSGGGDRETVMDFLRMEKWIFDSPDLTGEFYRKFIKDLFQDNLLIQNKLMLGGRLVDLQKIKMPLLNVIAEHDHLVPPSSSMPLNKAVASTDTQTILFPGGHIGLFVSSRSRKEMAPAVGNWISERSQVENEPQAKPLTAPQLENEPESKSLTASQPEPLAPQPQAKLLTAPQLENESQAKSLTAPQPQPKPLTKPRNK